MHGVIPEAFTEDITSAENIMTGHLRRSFALTRHLLNYILNSFFPSGEAARKRKAEKEEEKKRKSSGGEENDDEAYPEYQETEELDDEAWDDEVEDDAQPPAKKIRN